MHSGSRLLVLVALLVGSLILISCSTSTTPSQPGETPKSSPPVETPKSSPPVGTPTATKPYGSLTIAGGFGTGAIDPQGDPNATFMGLTSAIVETLLNVAPDGKYVGGIAERWEIAKDGMAHTFYIRKGVKFHDGSDLTGADVKFSIERNLAPDSVVAQAANWRGAIAGVDLIDAYTVALRMKAPQFELLTVPDFNMTAVVPKKYIDEKGIEYFKKNPIGSGPWKFVKYETGARLDLEANENYWGQLPKFKNITFLNVTDESTKVAMLKTGELDLAVVSPDSAPGLKSAGFRIVSSPGAQQYLGAVWFDLAAPKDYAVGDARVRKAMTLALNRKEIVDNIFRGYASPTVVYVVTSGAYFFDANSMKLDPYDPEQAKKLIAEAGYPNGFSTRIYNTTGQTAVLNMLNLAIQGYWSKVGINAELVPIEYGTLSTMRRPKTDPQLYNGFWAYPTTGGSIEYSRVPLAYHSTLGFIKNNTNSKLDELLVKVPTIADPVERKRQAIEAVLMAKNEYLSVPLVDVDMIQAVSSKIGEVTNYYGSNGFSARTLVTITHGK